MARLIVGERRSGPTHASVIRPGCCGAGCHERPHGLLTGDACRKWAGPARGSRTAGAPLSLEQPASVPVKRLYRLPPTSERSVSELVAVWPPHDLATFLADRHFPPRGVPMLKHVMALPRQTVCQQGSVVSVDGWVVGQAREHDRQNRPLPVWQGCRVIMADELFLTKPQSQDSLDGRCFGPLPRSRSHWPCPSRSGLERSIEMPDVLAIAGRFMAGSRRSSSKNCCIVVTVVLGTSLSPSLGGYCSAFAQFYCMVGAYDRG